MRRFYLFKRNSIYYVQLRNPQTGRLCSARSTGQTDEQDASIVVADWLANGIPEANGRPRRKAGSVFTVEAVCKALRDQEDLSLADAGRIVAILKERGLVEQVRLRDDGNSETLVQFLLRFWNYDESPYIREKRAHGQSLGRRHALESARRISAHWRPFFAACRLNEVKKADIKAFSLTLAEKKLAAGTINRILVSGTTALHWAYLNELIPVDPTIGVMRFSGKVEKRGVLTVHEAARLFSVRWDDMRARVGNLLAMTTGLRSGEVLALRRQDIGKDRLYIRHSWSDVDGLKTPKNGDEREVPVMPRLSSLLLDLCRQNPHGKGDEGFVFYSTLPDRPMDNKVLLRGLRQALVRLSVGEEATEAECEAARAEWKARKIVFHSWRHLYASRMADEVASRVLMQATGHKTAAVFDVYASHRTEDDFQAVGNSLKKVFSFVDKVLEDLDVAGEDRSAM